MITPISTYQVAARIQFGAGASKTVGDEVRKLGAGHVFLVTDKGVIGAGLLDGVRSSLAEAGIRVTLFDRVEPDPTAGTANGAAAEFVAAGCDCFVAVGGGSSMDCAKAAGIVVSNGGRIQDYLPRGSKEVTRQIPPLISIPTTAGTGSEVSTTCMITDEETHVKVNYSSLNCHSAVALVDPELTRTMPAGLTTATGLDALSHAIERYTATNATVLTDALALEAIRLVANNLRQAYSYGDNMVARENMMWAALLAAMSRAALTSVHAMSAVVGGHCQIPHGICCALLLPPAMRFNLISKPEKFAAIAVAMGEQTEGLSTLDAAYRSVEAVKRLTLDVGVTKSFRDFGLREEEIPSIAETCGTLRAVTLRRDNPRAMHAPDVEAVIRQCY